MYKALPSLPMVLSLKHNLLILPEDIWQHLEKFFFFCLFVFDFEKRSHATQTGFEFSV